MTSLTLVTLLVVVFGILNKRGYGRALALGGATPVGAALVLGATAVPTFYAVALGAAAGLVIRLLIRSRRLNRDPRRRAAGTLPLVLFGVWSVLVTLLAPQLFDGLEVTASNGDRSRLVAGALTSSNTAQILYLILGLCCVFFLSRARWAGPEIIGTAAGAATLLSFWAYLNQQVGFPYPTGLFDNSPGFSYVRVTQTGIERFRGIFSEPAGLATSSLITMAYMSSRATQVVGLRRLGAIVLIVISAVIAFVSTSATFVVAILVILAIAGLSFAVRFVVRRHPLGLGSAAALCALVIATAFLLPTIANAVGRIVDDKVSSSSYSERSGVDGRAYEIVLQTWGLGAGLGSHRPSSFLASLMGATGVVGTLLFTAAVYLLIRGAIRLPHVRPVVWALVSLLVSKVVSSPDLSDTSGILWLCLGVLAHAGMVTKSDQAAAVDQRSTTPVP